MSDEQIPTPNVTPAPTPLGLPFIPAQDFSEPMSVEQTRVWAGQVYRRVAAGVAETRRVPGADSLAALQTYIEAEIAAITGGDMMQKSFNSLGTTPERVPFSHPNPEAQDPATPHHSSRRADGTTRTHEHAMVSQVRGLLFGWHHILLKAAKPGADVAAFIKELAGRTGHHIICNEAK